MATRAAILLFTWTTLDAPRTLLMSIHRKYAPRSAPTQHPKPAPPNQSLRPNAYKCGSTESCLNYTAELCEVGEQQRCGLCETNYS